MAVEKFSSTAVWVLETYTDCTVNKRILTITWVTLFWDLLNQMLLQFFVVEAS